MLIDLKMMEFEWDSYDTACEPEAAYSVNKELNLAWEIIENTGTNLFLTGRAGTGKTTFLKNLRAQSSKNIVVLAPTGVAAINACGTTIHSFFQLPFSPFIPGKGFIADDKKYLNMSRIKKRIFAAMSLLVIDEISMVRPDILDAIDYMLRRLRRSSLPFGGVQLLMIGDLRQLPPVIKESEWEYLSEIYSSPYFYESIALKQAGYQTIELSMVYRQSDPVFIDILNKIRDGIIDNASMALLNNRCFRQSGSFVDKGFIRLTTHNNRAATINNARLASLPTPEFNYEAKIEGTFPESSFPTEKTLRLKEGSQVMFIKNDTGIDRKFYNGLIGSVVSLSPEKIQVKPLNTESIIDVVPMEWENNQYTVNEVSKSVTQEKIGSFFQYPLQLAWAITIHKSQGLTFDKAIIDAGHSFAPGQTYVALSRCRSLEGLVLEEHIPFRAVITDNKINEFVKYCRDNYPNTDKIAELKISYFYSLFFELFDFAAIRLSFLDFHRSVIEYLVPLFPEMEHEIDRRLSALETNICDVARKFIDSCINKDLPGKLSDPSSSFNDRVKSGCKYFVKNLESLQTFLKDLPLEIENRVYYERLKNHLDNLTYIISLKSAILSSISNTGFSVTNYIKAKERATISFNNASSQRSIKTKNLKFAPTKKKEKKPKGYSTFETLKLYKAGKSIPQIANERNLAESTISSHISQLITMDRINIEDIVDDNTLNKVKAVMANNPDMGYTGIRDYFNTSPDNIPPYLIRICMNYINSSNSE